MPRKPSYNSTRGVSHPLPALRAAGVALSAALACSSPSSSDSVAQFPPGGEHDDLDFSTRSVLINLGERIIATYQDFAAAADELERTTAAYAESLDADDRETAQQAWRQAIAIWQRAELFRFGPAGDPSQFLGGEGFADQIYSYSVSTNTCRVDQETLEDTFRDQETLALQAINIRGLYALEYLLFNDNLANTCPAEVTLNTSGAWQEAEADLPRLRVEYAAALAQDVALTARRLVAAWDPDEQDFFADFIDAGPESAIYRSQPEAFASIVGALLYLDLQTKERKLGIPAAISVCETTSCPDRVESLFAHQSKQHLADNLQGFELIFCGNLPGEPDAFGIDDQLIDIGAGDTARAMKDELERATSDLEAIEEPTLEEALDTGLDQVRALYDSVAAITTRLKADVVDELELDIAAPGAGDAD